MTASDRDHALAAAAAAARRLAAPPAPARPDGHGLAQSLAQGAAGIALLHIERARAGLGRWETAHAWLSAAGRDHLDAGPHAGLFYGVPSVAFAVHAASAESGNYPRAYTALHSGVMSLTRRRLAQAHARIDRGERPTLREYDLLYGLTGLGAYLLRSDPDGELLLDVLAYLVRLTAPLPGDRDRLPGWWTDLAPTGRPSPGFPGGHGNLGVAHGIAGALILLSRSLRRGIVVDGHIDAISQICAHLDAWRHDGEPGSWWPQWITRDELRTGYARQDGPLRPSWCYGTPGIARAQQIAAIATGDTVRQTMAEQALAACLSDPVQLHRITDTGLCHGWSGLYQTAWRAASDALTSSIGTRLPHLAEVLAQRAEAVEHDRVGLLDGAAGLALALHTAALAAPSTSGWDSCLLIN